MTANVATVGTEIVKKLSLTELSVRDKDRKVGGSEEETN